MKRPFRLRPGNRQPEAELQRRIAADLRAYLPEEVFFTASLSGVRLTPAMAGAAKAAGMQRGAPDLSFIFPDGQTAYLELKSETGSLSVEQARLARCLGPRMRVARSFETYREIVGGWLADHGLQFLTDAESLRREAKRRAAA